MKDKNLPIGLIIFFAIIIIFSCCDPKPEFYINGKPHYTKKRCVRDSNYIIWTMQYDPLLKSSQLKPMHMSECLEYKIDTIEIVTDNLLINQ